MYTELRYTYTYTYLWARLCTTHDGVTAKDRERVRYLLQSLFLKLILQTAINK